MHTFTDAAGREWSVHIDINAIRRVRQLASVDLMEAVRGDLLGKIAADPVLLVDILWAVLKPQADAKAIDAEAFAAGLLGDAIDQATTAFVEDLVDFFPSPTSKPLKRLMLAGQAMQERAAAMVDAQVSKQIDVLTRGASSPSVPASSEATPAA